ncbi:fructosamine kinase family protein [Barrientosiimonas marina]
MTQRIQQALEQAGEHARLETVQRVGGGSINDSYYARTANQAYFIKYQPNAPENFFDLETQGLELIRETQSIAVPHVYALTEDTQGAYLIMAWVDGKPAASTEWQLGDRIAALHQSTGQWHGFSADTFVGTLPQPNGLFASWLAYYRDQRLMRQLQLGIEQGTMTGKRRERMEKLLENLHKWVPDDVAPAYLHGDLWGGNWLAGPDGEPYVIDPSFLYGDRHFELAFTEVFGGFGRDFYQAYQERFPLSADYDAIKPVYQLYYLLVHLNMFGEVYGRSVDRILQRYIG